MARFFTPPTTPLFENVCGSQGDHAAFRLDVKQHESSAQHKTTKIEDLASTDKYCLERKIPCVFSLFVSPNNINLDCKQSLFSSKICGKERKTRKCADVTVSVM